jgi:flagellar motor switch protein FliN/FliY
MAETTQAVEEKTDQADQEDSKTQAQSAEFSEAAENETTGSGTSIDFLLDINVPVTVAIGRIEIPIQRLLQLNPGSVLKLDKPIEAPADLYLRDIRFATGNIVVVEDRFAVRIKEVLDTDAVDSANKE